MTLQIREFDSHGFNQPWTEDSIFSFATVVCQPAIKVLVLFCGWLNLPMRRADWGVKSHARTVDCVLRGGGCF